jgi:arabinose-5-phosphate isomerase
MTTKNKYSTDQVIRDAQAVLATEAQAISALVDRIDAAFVEASQLILDCAGHVILTGMGKSGHIAQKIAATLASTGTPAFFVHPAEASHGDLGMIREDNLLIALSNSGETEELLRLIPVIKRLDIDMIAITGQPNSTLSQHAKVHLNASVDREACPLGLAPTASTSAQLAMGDALALAVAQARGFTPDDFARSHPGGMLGRRLLMTIEDLMHQGDALPKVTTTTTTAEAIVEMTRARLGMCAVLDDRNLVVGIVTDGDLRRHINQIGQIMNQPVSLVMTRNPQTIKASALAFSAVELMQTNRIQGLLVTNGNDELVGALNFQDLLQAGLV